VVSTTRAAGVRTPSSTVHYTVHSTVDCRHGRCELVTDYRGLCTSVCLSVCSWAYSSDQWWTRRPLSVAGRSPCRAVPWLHAVWSSSTTPAVVPAAENSSQITAVARWSVVAVTLTVYRYVRSDVHQRCSAALSTTNSSLYCAAMHWPTYSLPYFREWRPPAVRCVAAVCLLQTTPVVR